VKLPVAVLGALAVGVFFGVGCNDLIGLEEGVLGSAGAALGGQGGAPSTGGAAGQGGRGGDENCIAAQCPGEDTTCGTRACDDGECSVEYALPGIDCPEFMGEGGGEPDEGVCDGMGTCVECATATQCSGTDKCIDNECVPATCIDGVVDYAAGETGSNGTNLECGGPCPECINGQGCNDRDDCAGLLCDTAGGGPGGAGGSSPMGTCIACTGDVVTSDCDTDLFCDGTNACILDLAAGTACTGDDQCNGTGTAVCAEADGDNVCCDTECVGTCQSCLAAKTGGTNGVCAPNTVDTDPDTDCDTNFPANGCNTGNCVGTIGACKRQPNGFVCDTDSGECDVQDICNGTALSCPNVFSPAGTVCGGGVANPICQPNDVCDATGTCLNGANAANGMDCPNDSIFCNGDEECVGGICQPPPTGVLDVCPGDDTGPSCDDSCNEALDSCTAADASGTVCNEIGGGSTGICNGTSGGGNCVGDT
jgi:hypothetical protein